MKNDESPTAFGEQKAAAYDRTFEKLAPMKQVLHLLMRMVLSELAEDACVLCVGAGTGAELLALAEAFPGWRFTVVEPAEAMLTICRQRAEQAGITARITFHCGTIDTLPPSAPFDAATAILVSHFLTARADQEAFFAGIAARIRSDGLFINAAIASDEVGFEALLPLWLKTLRYAGLPDERITGMAAAMGRDVAVLPLGVLSDLIADSGFSAPVLFCQTLLIHAWCARRL
ncbi:MAG: tRNA (cmo5U34)-methyltransferase [Myxococcota bacterium]|jgi:tRNA (cmo5U34)-methyltransferase